MDYEILIAVVLIVLDFFISFALTRYWIKSAKKNELVGKDMNKFSKPPVAEAGGVAVVLSIVLGILIYIFIKTFIFKTETHIIESLVIITSILLAGFIGFIDDILGWKKGLKPWHKMLLTFIIAIPLMVINAGHSTMSLPLFGQIDFGIIYPLILIPIGVVGCTNGVNLLAGYNGLEASLGAIIFIIFGIVAIQTNLIWLALIIGLVIASLMGFLIFNKYPAKVFPGDSLTYLVGALIGCFAIIGNMEKIALILFIPFILEGILKAKSKFKAENFGKVNKDNSLEAPYKKSYSLTHLSLKILKKIKPSHKVYEKDVVLSLVLFEIILGIIVLFLI